MSKSATATYTSQGVIYRVTETETNVTLMAKHVGHDEEERFEEYANRKRAAKVAICEKFPEITGFEVIAD